MHSQPRFRLRFGPDWTIAWSCISTPVNFTGNAELFIQPKDPRGPIGQDIVLSKRQGGRAQNSNSQITEGVETAGSTKLFANQDGSVSIRLIQSDASTLIRVWKLHPETKP